MPRQRTHNEWFMQLAKKLPKSHKGCDGTQYAWGEYVRGKWYTIQHFCKCEFPAIVQQLNSHTQQCGCDVKAQAQQGTKLPTWLAL